MMDDRNGRVVAVISWMMEALSSLLLGNEGQVRVTLLHRWMVTLNTTIVHINNSCEPRAQAFRLLKTLCFVQFFSTLGSL